MNLNFLPAKELTHISEKLYLLVDMEKNPFLRNIYQ